MRVKKLDIFGFKSFAQKQAITFGEGVTGIVGPNGCGKSNVVDALRWVMGEQNARHLRGGNMQDIIFCGSEKKAPLGFAEVTLTIDNNQQDAPLEYNHFQEIEITRRLYKTGESEYEINRQKARLKDISDFFLGTGVGTKAYSIIEQGRVNEIISAKPTDRRLIIEEAAGITKYKAKKMQAERRMETTRANLDRIVDIKNEVDKRVAVLNREKEKLEKVEALKARIREIDLHLASHQFLDLFATVSYFKNEQTAVNQIFEDNKRDIAALEHTFAKLLGDYSKSQEERRVLEELEIHHKTTLELLRKDVEYSRTSINDSRALLQRINQQLEEIDVRKGELQNSIETFRDEKEECDEKHEQVKSDIARHQNSGQEMLARRQQNLIDERDTERRIIEAATKAARLQSEITAAREQENQKRIDAKNLEIELHAKEEELIQSSSRLAVLEIELDHGHKQKQDLEAKLALVEEERKSALVALTSSTKELRDIEEERMRAASRLKSLSEIAERCEWSESGISDVLASAHKHLIKGVVADVIRVKPGYEDAVERYLAHVLDAAIVANNEDFVTLARFLKQKQLPETEFLLLNQNIDATDAKIIGLKSLTELISIEDDNFSSVKNHFDRFYLADNLLNALTCWPDAQRINATIITEDGEMLLPDGRAIILGKDAGKGILRRKNEMDELERKLTELDAAIDDLMFKKSQTEKKAKALDQDRDSFEQEMKTLSLGLARLEETEKLKRLEFTRLEADQKRLLAKSAELDEKNDIFDEKIANLSEQWSQALDDHKEQEETRERLHCEKAAVDVDYDTYQQSIREMEILKVSVYERSQRLAFSLSEAQKTLTHLELQKRSLQEQVEEKTREELIINETIRQSEKRIEDTAHEIDSTAAMLVGIRQRGTELTALKETEERRLQALTSHQQALRDRLHDLAMRINNTENQIKNVHERIREKYILNLFDHVIDYHLIPISVDKANHEKSDLQKTKDRIGSVNENAAREYEEFKTRSDFLKAQVDDLNDGLTQLETAIKKINKTTRIRFMEAFHKINHQFSQVFPRLFNGGKAELVLLEQEDLLSCGVDIIAKPPGKNIGSIELMSGGEKALTAISLIMAIFLIKPSPFCLLDEVDAPLDEANVARFSTLIKEMSELSQFIVITHNRKTMESADQLYGVTMEDAGQSKIVSVHVQQAFDSLRQKLPATGAKKATQLFLDDIVG